jgi:hypothetical protein
LSSIAVEPTGLLERFTLSAFTGLIRVAVAVVVEPVAYLFAAGNADTIIDVALEEVVADATQVFHAVAVEVTPAQSAILPFTVWNAQLPRLLSGFFSGLLAGLLAGLLSRLLSRLLSGLLSRLLSGLLPGLLPGLLSGLLPGLLA